MEGLGTHTMVLVFTVGYLLFSVTVHGFVLHGGRRLSRCPHKVAHTPRLFAYRETCMEFVTIHEKYWDDANNDCKSRGGHLVVIPDPSTQNFIMAALRTLNYQGKRLWIGLSDRQTEHHWKWVTGASLGPYKNFAAGENDDNILHWSQDCVHLLYKDHGRWHDNACHFWPEHFNYICQYDMIPIPKTTTRKPTTRKPTTSKPTTTMRPTTTSLTTTTTVMTTTVRCQDTNCLKQCPNGYSGLYVGSDGCIECRCN